MKIRKAVIAAAGLGTRLLTVTKEMPKEMLPLYIKNSGGELCLKPVLQIIFEQLFEFGLREFCFIVGRGKRSVEDHFTPDYNFVDFLIKRGKSSLVKALEDFYKKIEHSTIVWINQPEPKGFGHAISLCRAFVGDENFLVHAGDTVILSENNSFIDRLIEKHQRDKPVATLLLKEVLEPERLYGVAEVEVVNGNIKVKRVVEKPKKPLSNLAIMPIYLFDPIIFTAIEQTPVGVGNEIQLTDAIQKLIDWGLKVEAVKLTENELRLDVGTPETYWEALNLSLKHGVKQS